MNDLPDRWRDAWAAATRTSGHAEGACLDVDELLAAVDGRLNGARLDAALAALTDCPRCAAVAQIAMDLRTLEAAQSAVTTKHAIPPRARRRLRTWPWAAAAMLVLAITTVMLLPLTRTPHTMPVRAAPGSESAQPAPGSRLRGAPQFLAWLAIGDASGYRVELYDHAAERLWRSEPVTTTRIDLPPELRTRLGSGTYLWRVRVEGSDREIGPFHFTVVP